MSLESTTSTARIGSKSLRATIPEGIVAYLELENSDRLEWKMENVKGRRVAIVKKVKNK